VAAFSGTQGRLPWYAPRAKSIASRIYNRVIPLRTWILPVAEHFDVVVVGSGAGGLVAAVRAADLGLSVLVVEKAHRYGGTSAISGGGLWIPNHGRLEDGDSREKALEYLSAICAGEFRRDRVEAYVDHAPRMLRFLSGIGMQFEVFPGYPDYFPEKAGAATTRAIFPKELDGAVLGEDFHTLREQPFVFTLLNRYALSLAEAFALSMRPPGWRWVALKMFSRYWLDISWRLKTKRDRRLTMGNALIGGLRKALRERHVPLLLNTKLERLLVTDGRITGVELSENGNPLTVGARAGVVLAAGGFEQNQQLRDEHFPVPTATRWSLTPVGANTGDALRAAEALGAATELTQCGWWTPTMQLPSLTVANLEVAHQMFLDHRHPHSVCVNRLGKRFVNESCTYDAFGAAMIADHQCTGANVPCWLVFDAAYRHKYTCGGIMPASVQPDRRIPEAWWDHYLYRAQTVAELAGKIKVDPDTLSGTVARMNDYARTGVDLEYARGQSAYDRYFGDARVGPNPCLGAISQPPFYAVRIDLGDIGTKGGLKADASARVLNEAGMPIEGLYAVGNCAGAPFGDAYPGAGGTLGPAAVFGYIAANDLASRARPASQPARTDQAAEAAVERG